MAFAQLNLALNSWKERVAFLPLLDSSGIPVPSKVGFFTWEVWWDKVLTMNQLKRRGFPLASRCPLCGEEEDLHHLLIPCPKVSELWGGLLSCADTVWACRFLARDVLIGWRETE